MKDRVKDTGWMGMSGRDEEWQRATPDGVGEKLRSRTVMSRSGRKEEWLKRLEKIDKKREEEMK